jgi:hypothetical protein
LNAAQKAGALEKIFMEITAADPSRRASRGTAAGAEALFTGDARPFGLLVDKNGGIWQTMNIIEGGKFSTVEGKLTYIPEMTKWTKVQ